MKLLGHREMRSPGIKSLSEAIRIASDRRAQPHQRGRACFLLGRAEAQAAVHSLLEIADAEDNEEVAWAAFSALGSIRTNESAEGLLRILAKSATGRKKQMATYALRFLGDRRARKPLIKVLEDLKQDDETRGFAAEGIGFLRPTLQSIAVLAAALSDPSVYVRMSALCGLSSASELIRIRGSKVPPKVRRKFYEVAIPAITDRLDDKTSIKGEGTVGRRARAIIRRARR